MHESYFSIDEKLINSLWVPDLFFENGVGSSRHHVVRRNALLSQVFKFITHTIIELKKDSIISLGDIMVLKKFNMPIRNSMSIYFRNKLQSNKKRFRTQERLSSSIMNFNSSPSPRISSPPTNA